MSARLILSSLTIKLNISLKLNISSPPISIIWPFLKEKFKHLEIISTTSVTRIGWNLVSPFPISGKKGDSLAYFAKKLINWSSSPQTIEGLIINDFL